MIFRWYQSPKIIIFIIIHSNNYLVYKQFHNMWWVLWFRAICFGKWTKISKNWFLCYQRTTVIAFYFSRNKLPVCTRISESSWLAHGMFCKNPYFSTANLYDCLFMSVHVFSILNAVIAFLSSVCRGLTTISYSFNFIFDSSVFKNALTLILTWLRSFKWSSLTTRSDINVCWLLVSSKIFTTQNWAVCNKTVMSFLTKQVAVSSVLFDILGWLFLPAMGFGIPCFEKQRCVMTTFYMTTTTLLFLLCNFLDVTRL